MSDELWLEIIKIVGGLGIAAISVLGPMLIATLRSKYRLEVSAAQEAQLQYAAREAVKLVEELAAAKLKAGTRAMASPEKFGAAVATVIEKLPKADRAEIERKVTAAIVDEGMGAANNPQPAAGQ